MKKQPPAPAFIAPSLKALAENKSSEGVTKSIEYRVDPDLIQFEPGFNLREEGPELDAHIERLYLAMKAGAFIPPIDISMVDGVIIARDGHCRTRAARKLKLEMPEFTLEARQLRGNEADAVLHMLGTGSGSKPLSPLEQGKGYLRLVNMGLKPAEIATKLGVSRVTIDNGLTLAEAPVELQQMVAKNEVSSTVARKAVKQGKDAVEAVKTAVKAQREEPVEPAAKGKAKPAKKKVTAKTLRGTAAAKKSTEPDVRTGIIEIPLPEIVDIGDDEILVKVKKDTAANVAKFLRDFAGDDEELNGFASSLEMLMM